MPEFSRRRFLKTAGAGAAALATINIIKSPTVYALADGMGFAQDGTPIDWDNELNSYNDLFGNPPMLGRVIHTHLCQRTIGIFKGPGPDTGRIRAVAGDCGGFGGFIAPIYRAVVGEPYDHDRYFSPVWFETDEGYMHSGQVIPVREDFNDPIDEFTTAFWGEVTVPLGWQHRSPSLQGYKYDYDHYKSYYGQVHQVLEMTTDDEGHAWYRIYDDEEPNRQAWVLARHLRPIALEEFEPISPDVTDKHMEINLAEQWITCYEGTRIVFRTQIASGTSITTDDGTEVDFSTPFGDYHVQRKRPSRRMRGTGQGVDPYDVNGVPWCTYFTYTGAAIHGAYWHNRFGRPKSHGCINVTADAAKWIYRWSQPYLGYDEDYRWVEPGELSTTITVI